VSTVNIPLKG